MTPWVGRDPNRIRPPSSELIRRTSSRDTTRLGPSPYGEPLPPPYISSDEAWHRYLCTWRNSNLAIRRGAPPHVAATDDYRQKFLNRFSFGGALALSIDLTPSLSGLYGPMAAG